MESTQHPFDQLLTQKPFEYGIASPTILQPQIINHHEEAGMVQLRQIFDDLDNPQRQIKRHPFLHGAMEMRELSVKTAQNPQTKDGIVSAAAAKIGAMTQGVSDKAVVALLEASPIVDDTAWLSEQVAIQGMDEVLEANSRWIWNPMTRNLTHYIGHDAHKLLQMSRLLGLVPFNIVHLLREVNIRSAGASAVAHSLDLLAALGAEHIECWDDGVIDPSNIFRFPGGMGSYDQIGNYKVQALQGVLYGRNPYGKYYGNVGRVVGDSSQVSSPLDITYENFFVGGDISFEVVDSASSKASIRLYAQNNGISNPLVFVADVDPHGTAGIEDPTKDNHFNQGLMRSDLERMVGNPQEALRSVMLMVGNSLSHNHALQLTFCALGLIPYWSQTPHAAHGSAIVGQNLLLRYLNHQPIIAENQSPHTMLDEEMNSFSPADIDTLNRILTQVFNIG